jgi:RHS repeat-associated protein
MYDHTSHFVYFAYKFTGKERDAESGLDYFEARYYSSTMGRFMSPDWSAKEEPVPYAKLDDPQSLNLYAYAGNNPLARIDPDGHLDLSMGRSPDQCEANTTGTGCAPPPPAPAAQQQYGRQADGVIRGQHT